MRNGILIILLACATIPSLWAQGSDDRSLHSKLVAMERTLRVVAYKTKDTKTMSVILDDGFVGIDEHGAMQTKAELLRFVQSAESLGYTADAMIVRVHGETAIVTGEYESSGVMEGKAFRHRGRFVDTWLQKHGQWVVVGGISTLEP